MKYYLITNRDDFGTTVAMNGALTYLSAPAGTDDFTAYSSEDDFLDDLVQDLDSAASSGTAQLGVFVHGFDVPWDDSESAQGIQSVVQQWFGNMVNAGFEGVLLAFDWPSDAIGAGIVDQMNRAKNMAQDTASESFPIFAPVLQSAVQQANVPTEISFVCHSMGNYLMQQGASSFSSGGTPMIARTLLVAAELDQESFNGSGGQTPADDITSATSGSVTIYFDNNDDVLWGAGFVDGYTELGYDGPVYDDTLVASVVGVDATEVNTTAAVQAVDPGVSSLVAVHVGYFFLPTTLSDIVATMAGESVSDRALVDNTNGQGFELQSEEQAVHGTAALGRMGARRRGHESPSSKPRRAA